MTLPYERRRSLEWAGETFRQIRTASKDIEYWGEPVPERLRDVVKRILRHFPEPAQINAAALRDDLLINQWIGPEPDR